MRNAWAHTLDYAKRDKQEDRPRTSRFDRGFWLNIDLPDNPICWLLGHTGRARVVRYPDKPYLQPWEKLDCRVCGKRYADPHLDRSISLKHLSYEEERERARETSLKRMENIDRNPVAFARNMIEPRGAGWPAGKLELSAQLLATWPLRPEGMLGLHVGTSSSESPWQLKAGVGGTSAYLSAGGIGSRVAHFISGGAGRDLSIGFDTGFGRGFTEPSLRWDLWSSRGDDLPSKSSKAKKRRGRQMWRGKYRTWLSRKGSLSLNPFDHLHGGWPTGSHFDVGAPVDVIFRTAEGTEHQVQFTLQAWTWKRPKGPNLRTDLTVNWECKKGIGCRGPESGRYMGSGFKLPEDVAWIDPEGAIRWAGGENGWLPAAEDALRSWVTERRKREGWQFDTAEAAR